MWWIVIVLSHANDPIGLFFSMVDGRLLLPVYGSAVDHETVEALGQGEGDPTASPSASRRV